MKLKKISLLFFLASVSIMQAQEEDSPLLYYIVGTVAVVNTFSAVLKNDFNVDLFSAFKDSEEREFFWRSMDDLTRKIYGNGSDS